MTTLLEARQLAGSADLVRAMRAGAGAGARLAGARLLRGQGARAAGAPPEGQRHRLTTSNPTSRPGPGGLRDIQTIGWVAKRHFGAESLDELVTHGFLTPCELRRLKQAQSFLWKVRFGLHALAGAARGPAAVRPPDQAGADLRLRRRHLHAGGRAADAALLPHRHRREAAQRTAAAAVPRGDPQRPRAAAAAEPALPGAQRLPRGGQRRPVRAPALGAARTVRRCCSRTRSCAACAPSTIRAVARNLWLIDEEFRQNPRNHRLFLDILRAPRGVTHELRRMNDYGVLGRYIPAFGRVVGRMQYDLFHAYTVDAHTLFVVSNAAAPGDAAVRSRAAAGVAGHAAAAQAGGRLSRRAVPRHRQGPRRRSFRRSARSTPRPSASSRACRATTRAWSPGWSRTTWCCRCTAQKQDIGDPQVINDFARQVGDEAHLDYLYVLTCADVRGTNPKLWNSWKASLFQDFYDKVKRALRRGLESPVDQDELVRENQAARARAAAGAGVAPRHRAHLGAAAGRLFPALHARGDRAGTRSVLARSQAATTRRRGRGGGRSADRARHDRGADLRAAPAPRLRARHRGARPARAQHRRCAHHAGRQRLLARHLPRARGRRHADHRQRTPRRNRARAVGFAAAPGRRARSRCRGARRARRACSARRCRSALSVDERNRRSVLELVAGDRPGLLCDVGKVLWEERVDLHGRQDRHLGRARRGRVLRHRPRPAAARRAGRGAPARRACAAALGTSAAAA